MARVPAMLRPFGGPLANVPRHGAHPVRPGGSVPAPPLARRAQWGVTVGALVAAASGLAAVVLAALPGLVTIDLSEVARASLHSLGLAVVGTAIALASAVTLALGAGAGPAELRPAATRALALAAGVPPVVVAVAAWLTIGRPSDPLVTLIAVGIVQSLVLGPVIATRLLAASAAANSAADEAARDLGASDWARFRAVVWPVLARSAPAIVVGAFLWSLSDIVTPVLLADSVPTLPGLIWRAAVAGDSALAATLALILLAVSGVAGLVGRYRPDQMNDKPASFDLPSGWASLVLTIAVAVLFPLVMAPLILVTAAGGDLAPVLAAWPVVLVGALVGALLAAVATIGLPTLGAGSSWAGRVLITVPPPVVAVGVVVGFGGWATTVDVGPLVVLTLVGLVVALPAGLTSAPRSRLLTSAAREAAVDLGAHPASAAPPVGIRAITGTTLRLAAEVVGAGAVVVVALAGLSHPLVFALTAELVTQRPTAASAALSVLVLVTILRGVAAWIARPAPQGEQS